MEAQAEMESGVQRVSLSDPASGSLKQNREFLDYFWDIIKPEREVRLRAVENLLKHLRGQQQSDELKFTLKRLVDGLCHNREEARTGYSLALSQVLSVFEEISLKKVLDQIKEKHNLQTASKKQIRTVVFGNFFGVLALSQSNRLHKEVEVMLECVKILQVLSQYEEHLRDLPRRTLSDLLNEVSEQQFEAVLYEALQDDMSSALSDPQHLELLLLAMRRFTATLNPTRLTQLLGTSSIINTHTLPRLVEVVKMAVRSGKVGVMPPVVSDLLAASLRENSFDLFWNSVVIDHLIAEPPGPSHYLAFRVLGAALPQLSLSQLKVVLCSQVMRQYGEHALSAQLPDRFKFSPEMDVCVSEFMRSCSSTDKQLVVLQAFSRLSCRGAPVVPSYWKVLEQVQPAVMEQYVLWLQQQFCKPEMGALLEFSTRKQRENPTEPHPETESCVCRLRKWIIPRLTCILENQQIKKEEELIMSIARFILFHAFFETVRATAQVSETQISVSPPLEQNTRSVACSAFYSVLQAVNMLPGRGEVGGGRGQLGLMADGSLWVYQLVQFANTLLKDHKHTRCIQTFNTQQTQAWDSMLESVESLRKKSKKSSSPEHTAFQHLFLIVSIHMFKAPCDSVELLNDLHSCLEKAQAKNLKTRKKKVDAGGEQGEEPHWVEVVVEILLSLLAQPSRLIRFVCRTAFSHICPQLTPTALTAILNVLDPHTDEEESSMMVTEEEEEEEEEDEAESDSSSDNDDGDDDDDDDEEEEEEDDDDDMEEEQEPVDQNFRLELMKVLQGHTAPTAEGDDDDDEEEEEEEELDDEAMMKLDQNLASLFGAQKKKIQERKDEKERARKEKSLIRDFKTKVLDLVQVFLQKQGSSRLVMMMVEPLLSVIENTMSSESNQQEQDFLRRAAHIFRNDLCRGKHYCREVEGQEAELHNMLERLIGRAQRLSDSSVSLYYFSAALYVLKVLRGVVKDPQEPDQVMVMGKVDVQRVTSCFREALRQFMKRRHSSLTADMFTDLFNRFPVLCVNLLDTVVENISGGVREHQQGQACVMVLKALQAREVKQLMSDTQRLDVCQNIVLHVSQTLQKKEELKNKAVHERTLKALELCHGLIKAINSQKLEVDLEELQNVLKAMNAEEVLQKSGKLEDTYWSVMKLLGVQKPQVEKVRKTKGEEQKDQEVPKKKKKGFLPETKKRKNRKKPAVTESQNSTAPPAAPDGEDAGAGLDEAALSKKKKKKRKKKKGGAGGGSAQDQPPAKKTKGQPQQDKQLRNQEKNQKQKKKKVKVSAK